MLYSIPYIVAVHVGLLRPEILTLICMISFASKFLHIIVAPLLAQFFPEIMMIKVSKVLCIKRGKLILSKHLSWKKADIFLLTGT